MSEHPRLAPPSRADVERQWGDLIAGQRSREDVAAWARERMFARYEVSPEMLVMSAIQALDGFDLTFVGDRNLVGRQRGEGREYYHSDNHVAEELGRWLQQLADYDADPGEFMQAIARRTEQRRRGQ